MPQLYNSYLPEYKRPFGAAKAGEEILFTLRIPKDMQCKCPVLFMQKDGRHAAAQHPLHPDETDKEHEDVDVFTAALRIEQVGLYFYWFDLWVNYQKLYMGAGGRAVISCDEGEKYPLTVYDAHYETPKSLYGGVMYQIFPDRFFEGQPKKALIYDERIYRSDKQNEPYFWNEARRYGSLTQDYYGGDLVGIEKRLPYLASLGVTIIYLNPIFEAHSNHRYNTADYFKVDPYLGTNRDFTQLCRAAAKLGIRIILDGVFSHMGSDSIYFNKNGRYPQKGAYQGTKSPYRDWFTFLPDGSYDSWWGFETLPACNKDNADFRRFFVGTGGVIDTWLSLGAAGFRLDVADELPDDFIAEIRQAVKRNGEENLLIGEVWEDAALKEAYGVRRQYFLGQGLDGVMNYPFRTAIIEFLQNFNAALFARRVMEICEHYPAPALNTCTTHISSHDTERAITALMGEPVKGHDRQWQSGRRLSPEQYHMGIVRMQLAFVLQFTLPGIPCVYYGDEIAMQGYKDPFNRGYYNWNSSEDRLIPLMMQLSAWRRECPAFKDGQLYISHAKGGVLVYHRRSGSSEAHVAINCSGWPAAVRLQGEEIMLPVMGYAFR